MSTSGASQSLVSRRQKRMGPAPFASFEDLSDELDSPDEKNPSGSVVRLPGIKEDVTPSTPAPAKPISPEFVYQGISLIGAPSSPNSTAEMSTTSTPHGSQASTRLSLQTPSTPRIDISRASSSSQHEDSRDSTPERELFEGQDSTGAKLGLGFREEGTLDLRSSTEELDFQDPQMKMKQQQKTCPQSPCLDSQSYHQRKDSQSSEIGLLSISGRTSRLSSIGSQGSAQSRISNASHLSVLSGQSGLSRSPSPHKMLLETSFCGLKGQENSQQPAEGQGTKPVEPEDLEKLLLARKHDPTKAILAEGITVTEKQKPKEPPEKPARKVERNVQSFKSDITIKVDKPSSSPSQKSKLPRTIVSSSGVEYTYIPLKGPLPEDPNPAGGSPNSNTQTRVRLKDPKSVSPQQGRGSKASPGVKAKSQSPSHQKQPPSSQKQALTFQKHGDQDPVYIRIKLKPDYAYEDEPSTSSSSNQAEMLQKPASLNLNDGNKKPAQTFAQIMEKEHRRVEVATTRIEPQGRSISSTPSASPKLVKNANFLRETNMSSKSPSPSLSRKSSFCSLFKSKEGILSPDSPTGIKRKNTLTGILKDASDNIKERRRSRSKSRERSKTPTNISLGPSSTESIDSKGKQKSVFSIFKGRKGSDKKQEDEQIQPIDKQMANLEFTFNDSKSKKKYQEKPLEAESIRIPLHSPTYYENRSLLQDLKTSSQDSQETVIEAPPKNQEEKSKTETPKEPEILKKSAKDIEVNVRQDSTGSENVVFSTQLGDVNEVFSTKLPKEKKRSSSGISSDDKDDKRSSGEISEVDVICQKQEQPVTVVKKKEPPEPPLRRNPSIKKGNHVESKRTSQASSRERTPSKEATPVKEIKPLTRDSSNHKLEFTEARTIPSPMKDPVVIPKPEKKKSIELVQETIQNVSITPSAEETFVNEVKKKLKESETRNSMIGANDEDRYSSESEKDSEKTDNSAVEVTEPERKGLVLQQDSFEDELPYVPTTLPLERSVAIPIVPIKQRANIEMRMCPIERPRSTTPIIPSSLEDYVDDIGMASSADSVAKSIEKLKISLPKDEGNEKGRAQKSPRKTSGNWFDFAEKGIQRQTPTNTGDELTPPPLPPKGIQKEWINFEEIPEKRKPPKRIQTIPSRGAIEVPESVLQENVVYSYVNPEDCKCECHELSTRDRDKRERDKEREREKSSDRISGHGAAPEAQEVVQEDELPLLDEDGGDESEKAPPPPSVDRIKLDVTIIDRRSIVSDSSVDLSTCIEHSEQNGVNESLQTPFTSDLGISSNRSSIISQDEPQSPETVSPNAFPKTT